VKTTKIFLLATAMVLTLAACGTSGSDTATGTTEVVDSGYTVEVAELDANAYPEDYPRIAIEDFQVAYDNLKAANLNFELETYEDIVEIFAEDGAYYTNNDLDLDGQLFKYYGWYADNGASVLITFKADGTDLEYYAYTANKVS